MNGGAVLDGTAQGPDAATERLPAKLLFMLFLIYLLGFLDRQIVNIIAEPMKRDLALADWQLGALSGLAFAMLYSLLGIPVARLSDRGNRRVIISAALFVWSAFTALCGLSQNFIQILLCRIGVGMGEAGCSPPAQSLIADSTTPANRSRAFSIYSMAVPFGALLGMAIGGIVSDALGWRMAFLMVGLPGVALAAISIVQLPEPRANRAAAPAAGEEETVPGLGEVFATLTDRKAFWWLAIGAALCTFVGFGQQAFFASFFLRNHGPQLAVLADAAGMGQLGFLGVALGLVLGFAGALGTYVGGVIANRLDRRFAGAGVLVPALATLLAVPCYVVTFLLPDAIWLLAALIIPTILKNMWFGPVFAATQSLVPARSRATATAIFMLVLNLVGMGLGPMLLGALSDALAGTFGVANGLRMALIACTFVCIPSAICFMRAYAIMGADRRREAASRPDLCGKTVGG